MKLSRLVFYDEYKGTRGYLKTQGKYLLAKTILIFAISAALLITGIITTGSRGNALTIVAVLGCLPACKSAIDTFMLMRYRGCSEENATAIEAHVGKLTGLYDRVFTSYKLNFQVAHLVIRDHTICGFTQDSHFKENDFNEHISDILQRDGIHDVTIKIFKDLNKYLVRLDQMNELEDNPDITAGIQYTLNNVSL